MHTNWFPDKYSEVTEQHFILNQCFQAFIPEAAYLHFFHDNPFSQPIRLQIDWTSPDARITKSTLLSEDRISLESGFLGLSNSTALFKAAQRLKVTLLDLKAPPVNARDGSIFEICIGRNESKLSFKWWEADTPTDWAQLDKLASLILKLEAEADYSKKTILEYSIEKEVKGSTFEGEKSMFISYKEVQQ